MSRIQPLLHADGLIASFNIAVGLYDDGSVKYYGYSPALGIGSISNFINYIPSIHPSMSIGYAYDFNDYNIDPYYYTGFAFRLSGLSSQPRKNLVFSYNYNVTASSSLAIQYGLYRAPAQFGYGSGNADWNSAPSTYDSMGLGGTNGATYSIRLYQYNDI